MEWKRFFSQMKRAARLDKKLYTELLFDDYATANAVIVVAVVALLGVVFGLGADVFNLARLGFAVDWGSTVAGLPTAIFGSALSSLWRWAISAGGFWLAGTKLFSGQARFQTVLRLVGFAYVTLAFAQLGAASVFSLASVGSLSFDWIVLVSLVWYAFGLNIIARELLDISPKEEKVVAFLGVVAWLVAAIFR